MHLPRVPSSASAVTTGTSRNVLYAIPAGWSAKDNAGGVAISPVSGLQGQEKPDAGGPAGDGGHQSGPGVSIDLAGSLHTLVREACGR